MIDPHESFARDQIGRVQSTRELAGMRQEVATQAASPTASRLYELRDRQNTTHELVSQLEAALHDVLRPAAPESSTKGNPVSAAPAPLCEELDIRIHTESHIASRIDELLNRLTL